MAAISSLQTRRQQKLGSPRQSLAASRLAPLQSAEPTQIMLNGSKSALQLTWSLGSLPSMVSVLIPKPLSRVNSTTTTQLVSWLAQIKEQEEGEEEDASECHSLRISGPGWLGAGLTPLYQISAQAPWEQGRLPSNFGPGALGAGLTPLHRYGEG